MNALDRFEMNLHAQHSRLTRPLVWLRWRLPVRLGGYDA